MPFLDQTEPTGIPPQLSPPAEQQSSAPFGTLLKTAASTETSYGMLSGYLANKAMDPSQPADPSFDPFDKNNLAGYEQYAGSFVGVKNASDMAHVKGRIDSELKASDLLSGSGFAGTVASLAMGLTDPVNFIPVGGEAIKAYGLGKIATGVIHTAAAGAVASTVNEGIAQATQETRTAGQSVGNVAASTMLAGVLGGAISSLGGPKEITAAADTAADNGKTYANAMGAVQGEGSVGAAAPNGTTLDQETLRSALGAEKLLKFNDPVLRTAQSPSLVTRQVSQMLAEQPLERVKNEQGIASQPAVETAIRANWSGGMLTAHEDLEDAFVRYRLGREQKLGDMTAITTKDAFSTPDKMGWDDFREAVGDAMRNKDQHAVPEVAEAAKSYRANVFDPLKEDATKLGLLDKDVKAVGADSYLTRVYDVPKIVAERNQFEQTIVDWLKGGRDHAEPDADAAKAGKADFSQLNDGDLHDIASQVTDNITGMARGRLPYEPVPLKRGPLKDRTLTITDAAIKPWLESDISKVSRIYSRTMGTDVELTRAFGRADMQDQLDKIRDNYAQLRNDVNDPNALKKLDKQERADLRDIEGMRDRLRGTYAMPGDPDGLGHRTVKVVKNLNYLRLLGGMVLMGISHVGNIGLRNGVSKVVMDGLVPLVRNFEGFRLAADEAKLAGTAAEMIEQENLMSMGDVMQEYGRTSKFERGMDAASRKYGLITLMAPWIASMKQFSGLVTQTRMLRAITNMATADPKEIRRLAFLGIDAPMAKKIAAEFKKYGSTENGVFQANTREWQDVQAIRAFRGALSKEINIEVVTPGQEKPLWMSTQLGSVISQFHSFQMGTLQRVLLAGLQQRDMAALSGSLMMTGLGMFSYWAKTPADKLSNNPAQWVQEGVDRSGLTGWLFDANNTVEKATNGKVGVSAITGKQSSRYASRNLLGAVLGPSADLLGNSLKTGGDALQGNFSQEDMRNVRQMLPFQNLFYTRKLLDAAETGINQKLGVPKHSAQ